MNILIVSDAWHPQINGVVRTLDTIIKELRLLGHAVTCVGPDRFRTIACPTYPEIRLAINASRRMAREIATLNPDAIHIATEGPLGIAARRYCLKHGLAFTTAYHTRFPEYVHARAKVPIKLTYCMLRRFHRPSRGIMVATQSVRDDLRKYGFENLRDWSRGVDTDLFRPDREATLEGERPIWLYVGRVAVEKNIEAFLNLKLPGTRYVVGDGPMLAELSRKYPEVRFVGSKTGKELSRYYSAADVFVFPSRTDTFGLVLLEALASGLPIAAFPVPGPRDVVNGAAVGCLDEDLQKAAESALKISREDCRDYATRFSWRSCAEQFLDNLVPVHMVSVPGFAETMR
jgi:glycosyltransferase involved in cell wall biosynthesis